MTSSKLRMRSEEERAKHLLGLLELVGILNRFSLKYFIGGGTLLGLVRDAQLIPWDWDLEVNFRAEQFVGKRHHIQTALLDAGFKTLPIRQKDETFINCKIKVEKYDGVYELLSWQKVGRYRYRSNYRLPNRFFVGFDTVVVLDQALTTFYPREEYLAYQYGNWEIPLISQDKSEYLTFQSHQGPGQLAKAIGRAKARSWYKFHNVADRLRAQLHTQGPESR